QSAAFGTDKPLACRHHRAKSGLSVSAAFQLARNQAAPTRLPLGTLVVTRGTDGSNPFPSSAESCKPSVPQQRPSRASVTSTPDDARAARVARRSGLDLGAGLGQSAHLTLPNSTQTDIFVVPGRPTAERGCPRCRRRQLDRDCNNQHG